MEQAEVIRLEKGERIDVVKEAIGYSMNGPATVVVIKEAAAVGATAHMADIGQGQYAPYISIDHVTDIEILADAVARVITDRIAKMTL